MTKIENGTKALPKHYPVSNLTPKRQIISTPVNMLNSSPLHAFSLVLHLIAARHVFSP